MAVTWRITNWDDVVPSLKNFRLQYAEGGEMIGAGESHHSWDTITTGNATLIECMYQQALGRPSDPGGLAFWVAGGPNQGQMTLDDLADAFANGTEQPAVDVRVGHNTFVCPKRPTSNEWIIEDRGNASNDVAIHWDNNEGGSNSVENYDGNSTVKILAPGGVVCQLDWSNGAWWFGSNESHDWYSAGYKDSLAANTLSNELYPPGWDNADDGNASVATVDIKIILHAKGGGNGLNTSSLYRVNELGNLFEPRVAGDPILENPTGIIDGGTDLRVRYYPVTGVTTNDGRPGGGTKIPGKELANTGFCSHAYRSGLEYVHQDPSSRIGSTVVSNQGLLGYYNGDNDAQQGDGTTTFDLPEGKNEFGDNHSSQFPQPAGNPAWTPANGAGWWPGADGDQPYFTGQDIRHLFAAVGTVAAPPAPQTLTINSPNYVGNNRPWIGGNKTPNSPAGPIWNAVQVNGFDAGATVATVNVSIDTHYTWLGDLRVDLTSPDGTVFRLKGQGGGRTRCANHSHTNTATWVCNTSSFTGANYSFGIDLDNFTGETANGMWGLTLSDTYPSEDGGFLNNWGLTITEQ